MRGIRLSPEDVRNLKRIVRKGHEVVVVVALNEAEGTVDYVTVSVLPPDMILALLKEVIKGIEESLYKEKVGG